MNILMIVLLCLSLTGCSTSETSVEWQIEEALELQATAELQTQEDASEENLIYVYVCGAIRNPGVYAVAEGSRLYEVIEQAGGMLEEADDMYLNLAREVKDGEQILILTTEQTDAAGGIPLTENSQQTAGLVNINTATIDELTTLSGIGESRAQAIVEYREQNGTYSSVDEIMRISGIKEALFEKIKDKITVG